LARDTGLSAELNSIRYAGFFGTVCYFPSQLWVSDFNLLVYMHAQVPALELDPHLNIFFHAASIVAFQAPLGKVKV
jgi:hypothetical protein